VNDTHSYRIYDARGGYISTAALGTTHADAFENFARRNGGHAIQDNVPYVVQHSVRRHDVRILTWRSEPVSNWRPGRVTCP
jgi:hypothetical protein